MSKTHWAEREVELAISKMKKDEDGFDDYLKLCYSSALKAYKSLMEDGHSGMSFSITTGILTRLIEGKPLTQIEDTEDVWDVANFPSGAMEVYQCNRMSSLFKYVCEDGRVVYTDKDRVRATSACNKGNYWYSKTAVKIIDELFPITLPYNRNETYTVYVNEYNTVDDTPGSYDLLAFVGYSKDSDPNTKYIIGKYFDCTGKTKEITKEEFDKKRKGHDPI